MTFFLEKKIFFEWRFFKKRKIFFRKEKFFLNDEKWTFFVCGGCERTPRTPLATGLYSLQIMKRAFWSELQQIRWMLMRGKLSEELGGKIALKFLGVPTPSLLDSAKTKQLRNFWKLNTWNMGIFWGNLLLIHTTIWLSSPFIWWNTLCWRGQDFKIFWN